MALQTGTVVSLTGVLELDAYRNVQIRVHSCVAAATNNVPSWDLPRVWIPKRALPVFD